MSMSINQKYPGFPRPTVDCSGDKPLTVQASRDEVDINKIVARIQKGQAVPTLNGQAFFGDVSELGGLQDAFIKTREAEELFMQFPADVRSRFNNNPVEFVEFFEDPANLDEAVKLGFVERAPAAPVDVAPAATPAP
jgi:phage internal scaffolding protein